MHNRIQSHGIRTRLLKLIKKLTNPTPTLLLLPNNARPSHLEEGEFSGTGQEPVQWVSLQVHFGSLFFTSYLAQINKAKYFLRGRPDQLALWSIGLELPVAYLAYCLLRMFFDYFMYEIGSGSIIQGTLLRSAQIGLALWTIYCTAKPIASTAHRVRLRMIVLAWINLAIGTSAAFSLLNWQDSIAPLYGTCLPGLEHCQIGPAAAFVCASLSVIAIWIAVFVIHRRLLDVYLGSVPKFADHDCSGLSIKSLKQNSVVFCAYDSYVLPSSDALLLSKQESPIWLFDGKKKELSRKGQNILFSIARLATTKFLDRSAVAQVGHHNQEHNKGAEDGKEGRLWYFIAKIHSVQLRAYVLLVALILCAVSTQMSYTQHLRDIAHISQEHTAGVDGEVSRMSLAIDPVFKAKIKNNLPVVLASVVILWFAIALWLRNQQLRSFKRWDGQFVSILPRVGYLWQLAFRREQSISLPHWELIELSPEANKTIEEVSPEMEKVIHTADGIFLALIIEFLHLWH